MAATNLSRLRSEAASRVRNSGITDAQWNIWANHTQDYICGNVDFPHLIHRVPLSTVDSQRVYFMDDFIPGTIDSIVDETNSQVLVQEDEETLLIWDNERDDTGSVTHYSLDGVTNYEDQPSAASTIDIVSSSASDTTQKVRIKGVVGGAINYELLTLNGTSTVTGTLSFSEVLQITKDNTTVGAITVSDTTGSDTLALIPRFRYASEYQRINFYPVPDGVATLSVRGYRRPLDLINDEDIPDLPENFHELVILGMQARAHEYLFDFKRSNELMTIMDARIDKFVRQSSNRIAKITRIKGRPRSMSIEVGRFPPEYENRQWV
jgi:hypothetical protein